MTITSTSRSPPLVLTVKNLHVPFATRLTGRGSSQAKVAGALVGVGVGVLVGVGVSVGVGGGCVGGGAGVRIQQ